MPDAVFTWDCDPVFITGTPCIMVARDIGVPAPSGRGEVGSLVAPGQVSPRWGHRTPCEMLWSEVIWPRVMEVLGLQVGQVTRAITSEGEACSLVAQARKRGTSTSSPPPLHSMATIN